MKMPGPKGVIKVLGDQKMARRIEVGSTPERHNIYVVTEPSEEKENDED
jgi:hypothetical protein